MGIRSYRVNGGNISLTFFFAQISQSLQVILIPAYRFLLESSEAEISIGIAVQSSRDAQYLIFFFF